MTAEGLPNSNINSAVVETLEKQSYCGDGNEKVGAKCEVCVRREVRLARCEIRGARCEVRRVRSVG